ncbi:MAG: hypothetical protein ACPIOQ_33325, partial [Promethearchaeia archaeon]
APGRFVGPEAASVDVADFLPIKSGDCNQVCVASSQDTHTKASHHAQPTKSLLAGETKRVVVNGNAVSTRIDGHAVSTSFHEDPNRYGWIPVCSQRPGGTQPGAYRRGLASKMEAAMEANSHSQTAAEQEAAHRKLEDRVASLLSTPGGAKVMSAFGGKDACLLRMLRWVVIK